MKSTVEAHYQENKLDQEVSAVATQESSVHNELQEQPIQEFSQS